MYTKVFLGVLVAVAVALFIVAFNMGPVTTMHQEWPLLQGASPVTVTDYSWNIWLKVAVGIASVVFLIVLITAWDQSIVCWNAPYNLSRALNTYEKQKELLSKEAETGDVTPAGEGLQLKSKLADSIASIQEELQWIRYINSSFWWMFEVGGQRIKMATGKDLREIERKYCPTLSSET